MSLSSNYPKILFTKVGGIFTSVANNYAGTNMAVFGPAFAEKFGLNYSNTSDLEEAIAHLQKGG